MISLKINTFLGFGKGISNKLRKTVDLLVILII